jgi:hypothetical protein
MIYTKDYDNVMHWGDMKLMWADAGHDNVMHRADGKVYSVSCAPGAHRITHKRVLYAYSTEKETHIFFSTVSSSFLRYLVLCST